MNNYNYLSYDWYRNSNFNYPNMNNYTNNNLYNPTEGFEKGNMFPNLYNQYKNYRPIKPKASTEREVLLNELSAICFAAHELNLYLDMHPNDQRMIKLFNDYIKKENDLKEEYEKKYGPLSTSSGNMKTPFSWENEKWPWEVE